MGGIFVNTLDGGAQQYSLLLSPFGLLEGMVYWVFGADPILGSDIGEADLPGAYYLAAALAYSTVCLAVFFRRILRMNA
jgi:hypothetical protein